MVYDECACCRCEGDRALTEENRGRQIGRGEGEGNGWDEGCGVCACVCARAPALCVSVYSAVVLPSRLILKA